MPERFYVKTSPSSWAQVKNFFVKTAPTSWASITDAWVKVTPTLWKQFWSSVMSPSQEVEIAGTYGGYNNDTLQLRGKNYVWSPTPQSLKYYFRDVSSLGTFYFGAGGSSGATATNTISFYPSSTTYLTVDPNGTNYQVGGLTKYFFEVRATGASGTVYSSISSGSAPQVASPLAPTLSIQSSTSTSVTVRVTAASDTTGTWGFSSWGATSRYIVHTYDSVGGNIYTGGGRGGISATSSAQDIILTGLTAGREYTIYVLPTTGTAGSRPFPYNASSQTNGYSGYPGIEASIQVTTASPPIIVTSPTFTLQSGTANTINSVYRLTKGTWSGSPTEYRYEVFRNDIPGTVLATYPSTTTFTTDEYYDHTFTATTGIHTVTGSVIAKNSAGTSSAALAQQSVGPIIANPQSTGQQRRVNLPSNFTSGTTVYISTNGFIGIGADPSTAITLPTSGLYLSPLQGDQRQKDLYTYADASNFYVRWQGARYNDANQTIDYQAKFYWGSTAVDVYFVTNNLSSSNAANTTAVYNNGSETVNWSSSTLQTSSLIDTSLMTRNTSQNEQDDNRTAITASVPLLAGLTPSFGTNTATCGGFNGSVTNYSESYTWVISVSTGSVSWGTASGATRPFTVTGVSNNTSATVTVTTSRSGYQNGSGTTSATSLQEPLNPTFGTFVAGNNGSGTVAGSVTNYNSSYTWTASASAGTFSWGSVPSGGSGTRTFTITSLTASQQGTLTVSTSRSGYCSGSSQGSYTGPPAASSSPPTTPGTPVLEYKPENNTSTTWGYSASWGASSGSGTIEYQLDCLGSNGGTGTKGLFASTSGEFNLSRNDTYWQVRVRATNNGGTSWSGYSSYSNSA